MRAFSSIMSSLRKTTSSDAWLLYSQLSGEDLEPSGGFQGGFHGIFPKGEAKEHQNAQNYRIAFF